MRHAFDDRDDPRPATLDYAHRRPRPPADLALVRRPVAFVLPFLVICALSAGYWLLPRLPHCGEDASRVAAGARLRMIGQAARQYALDCGGAYPDSFATLIAAGTDLQPGDFISPRSTDSPASGWPTFLSQPGHNSYVWAGGGMKPTPNRAHVIGYEVPAAWNEGANFLYSDGSILYLTGDELSAALRSLENRLGAPPARVPPRLLNEAGAEPSR